MDKYSLQGKKHKKNVRLTPYKKKKLTKEERREKYTKLAREKRDARFERNKAKSLTCFRCRKKGHVASDCREAASASSNTKICFCCGSDEHRLSQCQKYKRNKELPYASCFVCGKFGHLASSCPKNERGIYVNGGSCRLCGSKDHLASKCPKKDSSNDGINDTESDNDDNVAYCEMDRGESNPEEII